MTEFGFNSKYMTKDNKPWFPIMGEMHYSRYPKQYWKESLYKIKSGGVEVVSTYNIWIHHEEIEGEFDFEGDRDLRKFVLTCKECGLYMMLRIGPWSHGEVRNGGFPDWLLKKDFEPRTNDLRYFEVVRKFYTAIYDQVYDLMLKDGGPIIGIQIENEYGHCGGLNGEAGEQHMQTLYQMTKEIGFNVPLYTATGWGGAVTGGLIPVMGGYCEAPWDQRLTDIEPSGNYIFTQERNDHNIGSDYGFGTGITFDLDKYPYLTAELGGGLQVTHHRRPVAKAEDIGAMSMVKLGSGVNLLGYYMYHGGTNPKGKLTSLQESRETGYPNDVPELSYDFRAPIREYGQISETYKEIKLLAMFLKDFGGELCEMPAFIPDNNPLKPTNQTDLRTSYRHNGKSGYVFVNNYQRRYSLSAHNDIVLRVLLEEEAITFPSINIEDRNYFFFPFNMQIGNAILKTCLATPLCKLENQSKTYIFYSDRTPHYDIKGDLEDNNIITLRREEAKNAWKVTLDKEYLIISSSTVLQTEQGIEFSGKEPIEIKVYPDFTSVPEGFIRCENEAEFAVYREKRQQVTVNCSYQLITESQEKKIYELIIEFPKEPIEDCFLNVAYQGDRAKLYWNGEFIADNFYTGKSWEIGLKRFEFPEKLRIEIFALKENTPVFLEQWPIMQHGVACELSYIKADVEYKTIIK